MSNGEQNGPPGAGRSDAELAAIGKVLDAVRDGGVEKIRVVFVDQHGISRGKTIVASGLSAAFRSGISIASTMLLKDTAQTTVFPVWGNDSGFGPGVMTGASDVMMMPDPETFRILPWAANTGWIVSDIRQTDGSPIALSCRQILRDALDRMHARGLDFIAGLEVEFYVLKIEDAHLAHGNASRPEDPPRTSLLSHGYQYLEEGRIDQHDDVMELLRVNAKALDLPVRTMESEFGPSQLEFTFAPMTALACADAMVLFRNMVKQVCRRAGLHATFMCRPRFRNAMGSGWHLHQSVVDRATGANLFIPESRGDLSPLGRQWVAGLLAHAAPSCLLTTPTVNGYKRYKPFALAPDRIQWARDNRGAMLRCLAAPGDPASRIENRVGESAANPYLYLASQILSGLDGVENSLDAPAPVEKPYESDDEMLPDNLAAAVDAFDGSAFYRGALGDGFVDYLCQIKRAEWQRYLAAVSEWEQREYFSLF